MRLGYRKGAQRPICAVVAVDDVRAVLGFKVRLAGEDGGESRP